MGVKLLRNVTLLISFLCQYLTFGLDLAVYKTDSYSNPVGTSEFTHFVTHNVTGTVYIGASDVLYQLREDWTRQVQVNTGVEECLEDTNECPNYNKILLIDNEYDRLITCGSETVGMFGRGTCETRDLSDIMMVLYKNENPIVSSGMLTTEAIIAPGTLNGGANTLYVAATYGEARRLEVPSVSRRTLGNDPDLFNRDNIDGNLVIRNEILSTGNFLIRYIHAYTRREFTYFVTHQRQEEDNDFISKINRVCQNSPNFNSFTEITLECRAQSGTVYNLIQAAYVGAAGPDLALSLGISAGDDAFYGVFAKTTDEAMNAEDYYEPSMASAMCVFNMDTIETMFYETVVECFSGDDAMASAAYRVNYLQSQLCPGLDLTEAWVMGQLCTALDWQYAKSVDALVSTAIIEWSDITPSSIITTTHRQHTVAFVGTAQGDMVKGHIVDKDKGREYERFSVGDHVLRDAEIDTDGEQLTILTKQQLLKLKTSECAEYTTCDECIGGNGAEDGDPYCGWCTLEKRCSLYSSCPMSDVSTRWLPYNSAQCVDISNVSPYDSLPITVIEQQIILTVEQLPDLAGGNSYQCIFDSIPPVTANKVGNELTCTTPAAANIPNIPSDEDHVTMQLHVYSTETEVKFVQRDFHFYECNTHKGCVACTSSDWACDWCIYSNRCTHNNSTCSEDNPSSIINGENNPEMSPRQGSGECPQLAEQTEESLVSVGVNRPISVTGVNLPEEGTGMATSYKCILNIEGTEIETGATRNGNDFMCAPKMYAYRRAVQELNVSLAVIWNNDRRLDDVYGFKVTLYKCDVDRPDCSRCLSGLTARPELMCGWCKTDGICTVTGSSVCSRGWIPADTEENCPAPVLTGVWPPSGPHEGNTVIAVTGTDLGLQFSDVMMVTVGGQDCSTDGLESRYLAGSSVSCRTLSGDIDSEAAISVRVQGTDGTQQQSSGEVAFTYRDPSVTSFEPMEGFAAGGTVVTITGQYLDACSEISAAIGSQCIINRMNDVLNETTAMCRTTSSPIGSSHPLVVSFDGATRQSQDTFIYQPNPTVSGVQPLKTILSGGITLTVTGKGFGLAQQPQMVMYIGDEQFKEKCEVRNDTMILCKTPDTTTSPDNVSRRRKRAPEGQASFGFIIGDVMDLLRWSDNNNVTLEYYEDPVYFPFEKNPKQKSGDVETIMGSNLDVASFERDVIVYIGSEPAVTTSLDTATLTITLPKKIGERNCINGTKTTHPCVVVRHGNLEVYIGTLQYPTVSSIVGPIVGIAVACLLLIIILAGVLVMYRRKVIGHKGDINQLIVEMKELEDGIAEDIREAFVELQTDVTDLTSDLQGTGMPFVTHRQYAISMFFAGLETRPLTFDPEISDEDEERAMLEVSKLLSNKMFLMAFIQTLDEDKSVPNRERLTIASLLTVLMILEDKLPYLTDVMITLMANQVQDAIEEERPKKLFQRTELIVEKLLSNWIALSLYDFLKDHAAYPLFLLYRAIKCQCEKGPIDAINGKSHISLNDDNIISERLVYEPLTLEVIISDEDGEKKEVKVLDIDTIGQVKGKILDTVHRNRGYSSRVQPWQVDLEWRQGKSGHLTLLETDVSSEKDNGWKRMNTLKHFSVTDGSKVALTPKQEVPNATVGMKASSRYSDIPDGSKPNGISSNQTFMEDGMQLWHLVKDEGDDAPISSRKSVRQKKQIREVAFPRLLGTKGTVQEYMDNMFGAILNTDNVPVGIKYIFDFFDGLAVRYEIEDDSVLHQWKSNILPLRFWQKVITNPQYIFDIHQSRCVEASLSVISQAFYDAFRKNAEQVSKDASYKKLLYSREIPKYRDMVDTYYSSVTDMKRVGKSALDGDLKETCMKFTGLFSRMSTLQELHKLISKYRSKMMEVLEEDEAYEQAGLAEKLENALGKMENGASASNDYT